MFFFRLSITSLCLIVLGCSHQDFGRPLVPTSVNRENRSLQIQMEQEERALDRARKMARVLSEWKTESDKGRSYHVGDNDVLEIGVLSLEQPGKVSKLLRTVEDGNISIPWIGEINVAGLTTSGIEKKLDSELAGRYIKEPAVSVKVSKYLSAPVIVTGAVKRPGVYYLRSDKMTILELLANADGLTAEAGNSLHVIRAEKKEHKNGESATGATSGRSGGMLEVDLAQLIDNGDLRFNLWLRKGDIVNVSAEKEAHIYVLGYVRTPGTFTIKENETIGPLEAVAWAGGLTSSARAQNSWILRKTGGQERIIEMDLTQVAKGDTESLEMKPGDTLIVGSGFFARLSEFVRPTVGAGVNYSPIR